MCGIVGYVGKRDSVPIMMESLRRLEYRGYDSAGIAVLDDQGRLIGSKAEGKLAVPNGRELILTDVPALRALAIEY